MRLAFDGHNDVLLRLHEHAAPDRQFLDGSGNQHLSLARAREGGFAAGIFAMCSPSPDAPAGPEDIPMDGGAWEVPEIAPIPHEDAVQTTLALMARAIRIARLSDGAVEIVRDVAGLDRCRREGTLGMLLHIEGAEAIGPDLDALEVFYAAGLRSVGIVWSRPNVFAHGVPYRFPASPDIGPGLTEAGARLVRKCNDLGVLVDVSHLNEAGFWDVAGLAASPFVASHSGVHALCPLSRSLTDAQLRALADAGGLVGIIFDTLSTRRDGRSNPATPLSTIVEHVRYVADLIGVDHVALGSDFDGAAMPLELADASRLPRLFEALAAAGFTDEELDRIAWDNWRRVLGEVLH
jgi:membrane dipeptidase